MAYTNFNRFYGAFVTWLTESTALVSLLGHTASDRRIFIADKAVDAVVNALVLFPRDTIQWHPDVGGIYETTILCAAYAQSRVDAVNIIGALTEYCAIDKTTNQDKAFTKNNIVVEGIKMGVVKGYGEELFEASSFRRTERSDIIIPDRAVMTKSVSMRWRDTLP